MTITMQPRLTRVFRFVRSSYADGVAELAYALDDATAELLDQLYLHGLAEFAYRNGLDLRGRIIFPRGGSVPAVGALDLPKRTLVPIGGGKDSLVAVEAIKSIGGEATAVWVGNSALIAACAERT